MLNEAAIRAAKEGVLWDGSLKGFGLRVGKTRKTFIVLVASGRRKSIGVWPLVNLATARATARKLLAQKTLGHTHPTHMAFDDAKSAYFSDCETRIKVASMKPRTLSDYRRLLKHFPFGRGSIANVTARDVLQKLAKLPPSEKHHAFTAARRFFRYAVQQHIIDRSPMETMAPPPACASRERVLAEDELRAVYATARAGDTTFHRITTLLVLTGQRRTEIAHLEWEWIEGDLVALPAWLTKNKRVHTFPIGAEAQATLAAQVRFERVPYVFPALRQSTTTTTTFNGWGKPKARFDAECGVHGWQLRDLRRTMSTYMAELHIPQLHVEKLLNHVSGGTQSPIAQVYNRYTYIDEMRDAVLKWDAYLGTLLGAR